MSLDRRVGLLGYGTATPGIGGVLRSTLEDFQVEELLRPEIGLDSPGKSKFTVFMLEKRAIDTPSAIGLVRRRLGRRVHYMGLKDAKSVSRQFISSDAVPEPWTSDSKQVSLSPTGSLERHLSRSDSAGNRFRIRVRGIVSDFSHVKEAVEEFGRSLMLHQIPNYYGYQRFGRESPLNHEIGRMIVQRRFADALGLVLQKERSGPGMHEPKEPGTREPIRWLRRTPIQIRRLLVDSYRAYIFNLTLGTLLEEAGRLDVVESSDFYSVLDEGTDTLSMPKPASERIVNDGHRPASVLQIPLVGYGLRLGSGRVDSTLSKVLAQEGVASRDFYIGEMQELSAAAGFRPASVLAREFLVRFPEPNEGTLDLEFTLARGCFATVVLRELMKPENPQKQGF